MRLKIDPEFKALIPPLASDELDQLDRNIVEDGCRDPLVTWKGIIVDGHNRLAICKKHKIAYEVAEKEFQNRTAAMIWMIENQKGRRNVSDYDKGLLALAKQALLAKIGTDNKVEIGKLTGRGHKKVLAKLPKPFSPINSREDAAKDAGISGRTLDAVKIIKQAHDAGEISDQVIDDLRNRKVAIHRVAKDVKQSRQKQAREHKRKTAAKDVEIPTGIIVGDFREHSGKVNDGSISLIFTDPPYDRNATEVYSGLGQFAADKLCDGGSLVCYIGHIQILDALAALSNHLRFWWICACFHSGKQALMREYGIRVGWKPILWFVKNTRHDKSAIVKDVVTGSTEKEHHDWQQAEVEARYWIEQLCPIDGLVCDPFLGGGTTAVVAKQLGRSWTGFEINEDTANIAAARIEK